MVIPDKALELGLWTAFLTWTGAPEAEFWAAVIGAAAIKVWFSHHIQFRAVVATFLVAVFMAWLCTDPLMAWREIDPELRSVVGAGCALLGELIVRGLYLVFAEPEFLRDVVKRWLGGGDKQ